VYVCDRQRNRVQVFQKSGRFVKEAFVAKNTPAGGGLGAAGSDYGAVGSIAFSADPEQRYLYIGDTTNSTVWILRRSDLHVLGSFGRSAHMIATDSKGNLYIGQNAGAKYLFKGVPATKG
jgi:hypothetical protein